MAQQGLDTSRDRVYPDLAFGLPVPSSVPAAERTVGVGLMDYSGNDAHGQPDEIRASYVAKMKSFTRWLVDNGRQVRLFVGDTNNADETVVEEILADLRTHRPDLDVTWIVADPVVTFADLMRAMAPAGIVVATRYHNVICALMLSKPTISIGYAEKNAVLMAGYGTGRVLPVGRLPGRGAAHHAVHRARTPCGAAAAEGHRGKRGKGAARRGSARGAVGGTVPNARSGSEPGRPAKPQSTGRFD